MSDDRTRSPDSAPPSPNHQRRGSFSFADFMSKPGTQRGNTANQSSFFANAANNAQSSPQRRLSITTLGLSGSPTQPSPFGSRPFRRGSLSGSLGSNTGNTEEAVTEENESSSPPPNSPFSRSVSFGAQALRDARRGSMTNGRYPPPASSTTGPRRSVSTASSSSVYNPSGSAPASSNRNFPKRERADKNWRHTGEGLNWTEALRSRAERAPSIGAGSPSGSPITPQAHQSAGPGQRQHHQRSASLASTQTPPRDMPKRANQNKPDFFQEKILRGDFMD